MLLLPKWGHRAAGHLKDCPGCWDQKVIAPLGILKNDLLDSRQKAIALAGPRYELQPQSWDVPADSARARCPMLSLLAVRLLLQAFCSLLPSPASRP